MNNFGIKKICVLHEYGAINHYKGLTEFCVQNKIGLEFYEFRFIYQFLKSIYRRDAILFRRSLRNLFFLIGIIFSIKKKRHLILGVAPYDWRMVILNYITRHYNVYLHTSWPFWQEEYQPKINKYQFVENSWYDFIYRTNRIFAVTQSVKTGILKKFSNLRAEHIEVVYHAIDNVFLAEAQNSTKVVNEGVVKVIYVGRFEEAKGLAYIEDLANKTKYKNIEFYFVGNGNYKFKKLDNCKVLGNIESRPRLAKVLSDSDVLLLPGEKTKHWQELFGMVIIEAMCCGVFPITTNHLGPSEILSGIDGTLVDRNNILFELEKNLDDYLSKSYLERIEIQKMLKTYADNYRVEAIAQRWEKGL